MAEQLIGGFMSSNIGKGRFRGYGIYVTSKRIIGVKAGLRQRFDTGLAAALFSVDGAFAGGKIAAVGMSLGQRLSEDACVEAIELLEEKKDFEVSKEELVEARIRRNKGALKRFLTNWGDLIVKTPKDTYIIKVGIEGEQGEFQKLKDMFTAFDKDKFVVEDK